jgi:2OG-Fe(II) oxygenase superfamily
MLRTDGGIPSGVGVTAAVGLGRGERAPDMVLPSGDGTPTRYYAHAGGRPALLVFADQACAALLQALAEGLGAIGDKDLTVHVVGPPALAGHDVAFPLLQDADGRAAAAYRTGGAPTAFLLDPNLRVRATLPLVDGARVAADVAELVAELVWDDRRPREITTQASDRGFFRAHRDNLSPATAHRRFALTLNLNDGYQGGQLRFPEYGPELYRPAPGAALLFSCSHLHEVLEVTDGRRFALLSFLFGDEAPRPE